MKFIFYIIICIALTGCLSGDNGEPPDTPPPDRTPDTVTISCVCLPDILHHTELMSKPISGVGSNRAEAVKDARSVCDRYAQYNTLSCL